MRNVLDTLIQVITVDIFVGYGLYSLIFILVAIFERNKDSLIHKMDLNANMFIVFSGMTYILVVATLTTIWMSTSDSQIVQGRYWWGSWLQPFIWIVTTQLLWIKWIRNQKLIRLIIAVLLIVSLERYVIIVTSFHRDYLPGTGMMLGDIRTFDIVIGLLGKVVVFCLLAGLYAYTLGRVKSLRTR